MESTYTSKEMYSTVQYQLPENNISFIFDTKSGAVYVQDTSKVFVN